MPKKKQRNVKLGFIANMPPLYHTLPGEKYHFRKSEVLKWISKNPALLEYVFNQATNAKEIVFDQTSGKWVGIDYEED